MGESHWMDGVFLTHDVFPNMEEGGVYQILVWIHWTNWILLKDENIICGAFSWDGETFRDFDRRCRTKRRLRVDPCSSELFWKELVHLKDPNGWDPGPKGVVSRIRI